MLSQEDRAKYDDIYQKALELYDYHEMLVALNSKLEKESASIESECLLKRHTPAFEVILDSTGHHAIEVIKKKHRCQIQKIIKRMEHDIQSLTAMLKE